ncbi:MAG: nucleotide exchange factor GrpE [Deltaproteobacteria bacterium]|nr:nucleotide exchange factor GrpE [Deltaproteobacteria bacterium]
MKPRQEDNCEAGEPVAEADEGVARKPEEAAAPTDEQDAPVTLPAALDRIEELARELTAREEEAARLREHVLRERAELENFKKRITREKSEAIRYAAEPLLRDLLPAIDNLERALAAAGEASQPDATAAALRNGVAMVAQQLREVLPRHGVTRISAAGQEFDPSEHEALAHVVTTETEPGSVHDEHLPGYRLHDRLLRPAQVTVAKSPIDGGN